MAQYTRTKHTEVLILGTSFSALLIAESARQLGHQVTILEPNDQMLGLGRALKLDLDFIPRVDGAREQLQWLSDLLRLNLHVQDLEMGPVHFDEGTLKAFLGFGEKTFASKVETDFYTQPFRLEGVSLSEIQTRLGPDLLPLVQTRKQATRFVVQEGRLAGVEVNGDELWTAKLVVAPQTPSELLEMLSVDSLEGRHRTRLAKAPVWGSVSLHLLHKKPLSLERGIHVLYGSGQESEPVLGRLWASEETGQQLSIWMTLVPQESSEDTDFMSHALKHLKRQLKRAYPTALDDLVEERLVISNESHGHVELKTKHPLKLPEVDGLLLCHPLLSRFRGPLASVDVAALANPLLTELTARPPVAADTNASV